MVKNKALTNKSIIYLVPSLIGFSLFYLGPFIMAFYHTVIQQGEKLDFVGFDYYIQLFNNEIFMRGLNNTLIFIGISVPISMSVSLAIAIGIQRLSRQKKFCSVSF